MDSLESRLARSLDAAAETAFDRLGRYDAAIQIAGHTIRLGFAGEALRTQSMLPLVHIRVPEDIPAEIEVLVWDAVQSGVETTPETERLTETLLARTGTQALPPLGLTPQGLYFYDALRSRGYHWLQDALFLDEGNKAAPIRLTLSYALADRGIFPLHAAALAHPSGGVLLCGRGGAGKSTTSLACARSGFEFAADDFCFVELDEHHVMAHSAYASAKVFAHRLPDLPEFASLVSNPNALEMEKAISFLSGVPSFRLSRSVAIDAVIVLASKGHAEPRFERISPVQALVGLAPSTVLLFRTNGRHLAALRDVAARVPCFFMHLASDIDANPPAIAALLDSLRDNE